MMEKIPIWNQIPLNSNKEKRDDLPGIIDNITKQELMEQYGFKRVFVEKNLFHTFVYLESLEGSNPTYTDIPNITPFLLEGENHPTIIICPGGAYIMKAFEHEGYDIARYYNKLGFSAFVLDYRVAPYHYPAPMLDLQRAVRYVRFHHQSFGINPDQICAMGFSAGGNLVATVANLFCDTPVGIGGYQEDEIDTISPKINALVPIYPKLSFKDERHLLKSIFGFDGVDQQENEWLIRQLCLEDAVGQHTPPTFIANTIDDDLITPMDGLLYGLACVKHKIPFELHTFSNGGHGYGLAKGIDGTERWPEMVGIWLKHIFKENETIVENR